MSHICPTQPAYSRARIFLHWLSAAIILWATVTGFTASCFSKQSALRMAVDLINPQLTTLFVPFFLWRAALYCKHRPWAEWARASMQERLALLVHGLLYTAIATVLATGVLMMPMPWKLLGLLPMPVLGHGQQPLFLLHKGACTALAALVILHLSAVMWHLRQGHPVLRRMTAGA